MSDGAKIVAVMVACIVAGVGLMSSNWNRIDAENNAFAKDCNDRGGRAEFTIKARQCIGATATKGGAQ